MIALKLYKIIIFRIISNHFIIGDYFKFISDYFKFISDHFKTLTNNFKIYNL